MATYYVWSGATGTASGASWTNAFLTLAAAIAAATVDGDVILVQYNHSQASSTGFAALAEISIASVDKDNGDAFTPMSVGFPTTGSSSNTAINPASSKHLSLFGIRWVSAATGTPRIFSFGRANRGVVLAVQCTFGLSSTNASNYMIVGGLGLQTHATFINCVLTFGSAAQRFVAAGSVEITGGSFGGAGGYISQSSTDSSPNLVVHGCDLSELDTLIGDNLSVTGTALFSQCKLKTGYIALAPQTVNNRASQQVTLIDCAVGDSHGIYEYHNALGSLILDAGIYYTASAGGVSWRITTTSAADKMHPFVTPWLSWHHSGVASITPRLEILRDGSATAYTDAEVWSEWTAKVTSGTVLSTHYGDRQSLTSLIAGTAGVAQAAGAGLGSWTGESGTAWSGKLDSTFTPAEAGDILARVCVAVASSTVYVNPEPLTA